MKLIDKIALNRLLSIISSFILSLVKIFANRPDTQPKPKRKRILPWRSDHE